MSEACVIVNGEAISDAEIREEVGALRKELESRGYELSLEQRLRLRERASAQLIERRLILQECRRLNIAPSAMEVEALAGTLVPRADGVSGCRAGTDVGLVSREAERRLAVERLIAHWSRKIPPPKSTEVKDYYRGHREEFWRPEAVHAAHIVRNKEGREAMQLREELEATRQRIVAGEDFAALATTCSDCPENGGDLGYFARGVMVEEFDEIVFAAPLHEVTPVFETRFGLHIAIVHDRRPEGIMELDEVGGQIAEALYRGKQDKGVGRQLEALRRKADVRMNV